MALRHISAARLVLFGLIALHASAADAAPRSSDEIKRDEAWLAALGTELHDDVQRRKNEHVASTAMLSLDNVRFAYDRTSIAHVVVENGLRGTTVHVSAGWMALAENVALADLVTTAAGQTMATDCNRDYLTYIAGIVKPNHDYERGAKATPQAIEGFHAFVDADHKNAHCEKLAALEWRDPWQPRWSEVHRRVEAGLLWWMALDIRCHARASTEVSCSLSGTQESEARALLKEFGMAPKLEAPIKVLRLGAFANDPN